MARRRCHPNDVQGRAAQERRRENRLANARARDANRNRRLERLTRRPDAQYAAVLARRAELEAAQEA